MIHKQKDLLAIREEQGSFSRLSRSQLPTHPTATTYSYSLLEFLTFLFVFSPPTPAYCVIAKGITHKKYWLENSIAFVYLFFPPSIPLLFSSLLSPFHSHPFSLLLSHFHSHPSSPPFVLIPSLPSLTGIPSLPSSHSHPFSPLFSTLIPSLPPSLLFHPSSPPFHSHPLSPPSPTFTLIPSLLLLFSSLLSPPLPLSLSSLLSPFCSHPPLILPLLSPPLNLIPSLPFVLIPILHPRPPRRFPYLSLSSLSSTEALT
ncbi:unnamed protein product [Acanthosepion pharaonis]|uniref:Uncharacterized protein n=1 Tax=Acanthosepion pharaonis TaxID=158019 RepID=A0A812CW64_ACAPH|nr:unnamed protein product [Sepia pharaonis]